MKKIVSIFVVGLIMFAGSAAVSWHLRKPETGHKEEPGEQVDEKPNKKVTLTAPIPKHGSPEAHGTKPPLRPSVNPAPENVVQMASNLRQQQEIYKTKEEQLQVRKKNLELIFQDMSTERKSLDGLRAQIAEELKGLAEKLESLEKKALDVDKQKKKLTEQASDIKKSVHEIEGIEQKGIKQIAGIADTMDPDVAADIFLTMVDTGKLDTAVKVLSTMRDRQAARVLAQIPDRAVAAQIFERLKSLKRSSSPGPLE